MTSIARIARFGLTTDAADRLAAFYETALGFRRIGGERHSGAGFERLMGVTGGATSLTLGLGRQIVELFEFDTPGRPYPNEAASSDIAFQHFAIVVSDMRAAYDRLEGVAGWRPISRDGPQRLPESSGGVTAFKFRDPEGHPLELLAFPDDEIPPEWRAAGDAGPCLGIDHSAISVADTKRSVAFYDTLGFRVTATSRNRGPEQARLDGLPAPEVEVTALAGDEAPPHLELLGYAASADAERLGSRSNDVAATRLVLAAAGGSGARLLRSVFDPDGHHLLIEEPAML